MSYKNLKDLSPGTISSFTGLNANNQMVRQVVTDYATSSQGAKADSALQANTVANVAISGSYNDLTDKPVIPAAQVNSDWTAGSGIAQILHKPTLGTAASANTTDFATNDQGAKADTAVQPGALSNVAFTGSYTDLSSRPNLGPLATISMSGTATANTFVRGDGTWSTINYTIPDSTLIITGAADATKKIQFDANAISANTTATLSTSRSHNLDKFISGQYAQSLSDPEKEQARDNIGVALTGIPIGMICWFATDGDKDGFLRADGRSFDPDVYPELAIEFSDNKVPNIENRVLRMVGDDTPDVGDTQEDALENIQGDINIIAPSSNIVSKGSNDLFDFTSLGVAAGTPKANRGISNLSFDASQVVRTSDETRVKSFIGVAYVKAYGSLINDSVVDLIAIETAQQYMVRWDAQALTNTAKIQTLTNIANNAPSVGDVLQYRSDAPTPKWTQDWETIFAGSFTNVASFDVTDLDDYDFISIEGRTYVLTNTQQILLQTSTDNGSSYATTSGYYYNQILYSNATTIAASRTAGTGMWITLDNVSSGSTGGGLVSLLIHGFNRPQNLYSINMQMYVSSGSIAGGICISMTDNATARNAFRLIASSGNISGNVIIKGWRG